MRFHRLVYLLSFSVFLLSGCQTAPPGSQMGSASSASVVPDPVGSFTELPRHPTVGAGSAFWDHWGDGQAELSSYRITLDRYGEQREGELVLIYVTESMDRRTWIKDESVDDAYRVPVLKLNVSLKFLTGIYPYSVMTSVFAPVDHWFDEPFTPVKIGLSAQEWCGMYFHQVWPGRGRFLNRRLSYFAEHGEKTEVVQTDGGVLYEDALLIQLRELAGSFAGGEDWTGRVVPTLWSRRTAHQATRPLRATITRSDAERNGAPVTRFVLTYQDPLFGQGEEHTRTFEVEQAPPHRILGWTTSRGETAALVETQRLPYWKLNGNGDEQYRAPFGLETEDYYVETPVDRGTR